MSASNLFMNWVHFTFTPLPSGTPVVIESITSCKPHRDGAPEKFKAGAARFNQLIVVPTNERMLEIDFGDVATAALVPIGVPGTVTVKLADAANGVAVAGGGLLYTLGPCVAVKNPAAGDHGKYASTTLNFEGYNSDGVTDPMTIAPL
jgi:hypothetical protein